MALSKDPVRIRKRKIKSGLESLYLDIYVNGRRAYETLRIYLEPEHSKAAKDRNKERWRLAEAVRAKRILEVQNGRWGFESNKRDKANFLEYVKGLLEEPEKWHINLSALYLRLERYCHSNTTFRDITPQWVQGFKEFLWNGVTYTHSVGVPLANSTKTTYFSILVTILNKAVKEGIIRENPASGVGGFKKIESERLYLTLEEVRAMANAPCRKDVLKRAFMFSCLTGLRVSDIISLCWEDISKQGDFTRIIFRQKKTKHQEYLDISEEAAAYLGERGSPKEAVFKHFEYNNIISKYLREWASHAGINKKITFHTGRHTFAVLMLELDVDIYTLQKLLGHSNLSTTAIYAKVVDRKKQEAVSRIPKIAVEKKEDAD